MGTFHTDRELFKNPIWKNITEFRIFFLIYGSAIFAEEGYRVADNLFLERGQWCRSTRKLQEDLTFIENRQIKTYSTSTINRCIKSLVQSQRICTKTHELGTVFTVLNYDVYQGFGSSKKGNLERNLEQSQNSDGTVSEQSSNNNKKENKEKKEKKVKEEVIKTLYGTNISLTEIEYEKLCIEYGIPFTTACIEYLESYKVEKSYTTKSDYLTIKRWVVEAVRKTFKEVKSGQGIRQGDTTGRIEPIKGKNGILPSKYAADFAQVQ